MMYTAVVAMNEDDFNTWLNTTDEQEVVDSTNVAK